MSMHKLPPQTLAQKLIARAAGRSQVAVGEVVTCNVDIAMFHDSSGPRRLKPMLDELGASIWDTNKVVLVLDHYVPARDADAQKIVQFTRDTARQWKLPHVIDSEGICHVVLPERGHLRPGMFGVGGDSHSPTGGAFGSYMFGIGATEMLGVCVTGQIWVQVPRTLHLQWAGRLQPGVSAKDMMLHTIARLGMNGGQYQAVEFAGSAVRALSMPERMTLSNMSAELGAQAGLIAADDTTREWLEAVGVPAEQLEGAEQWFTDEGANFEPHSFDATALSPQVAAPHSPANTRDVAEFANVKPGFAYIGACTGAKLEDLRAAASVLRGRHVAAGVQLVVAPASAREQAQAEAEGVMQVLRDAGAAVLPNSCGACAGYGGTFPEGATVISSTARNFKGRMGPASVNVYLASPYTVAASALRGHISDAREMLA
ncbi:MAG: 3-isopropylmalate dehydratase large subunit [Hydrogenophaga sp.]|jgi:3-isopropylmalate/(R)-2-methylmalate dehydratase large subunit|uniref:3-isopropylmalate dehydratase large subunit n=1 Tax=Hydrogenophaga sp. TaxID=1904254 RepID=UPI001D51D343|nr:3-isopropylmalate dehydratase large subunit [Hydrogenophaga sp.]MBW0170020.1 3-isopropylmalate dehydratase large subunit [Hydrogenophaga sp.]MBW0183108.1 3-isopropylmalate dehydratase large subunit [Hydrogenophaga sp.]